MSMSGISKSSVSKLCKDIDERVNAFLKRPLAGEWPYLLLDVTYLKVRGGGRIARVAAIIAVAVDTEGKREIGGLHIGPSEAEPFWSSFHRRGPWRSFEAVEYATLEWVDWFNNRRLLAPIGNIPPAEAEELYYAMLDDVSMAA